MVILYNINYSSLYSKDLTSSLKSDSFFIVFLSNNISLDKIQNTIAKDFLPLLFTGITKSIFFVELYVLHNATTGILIFVASLTDCASANGSTTNKTSGSQKF